MTGVQTCALPIFTDSSSSGPSSSRGRISVVLPKETPSGEQIWNNYGAKPNDELLLAYGFTLPSLSYDTSPLLLAAASIPPASKEVLGELGLDVSKRFLVGRDGVVGGELRCAVRVLVGDADERATLRAWSVEAKTDTKGNGSGTTAAPGWWEREVGGENEMNVVELLGEMVRGRLAALRAGGQVPPDAEGVREEVRRICVVYRQGQSDRAEWIG